MDKLIYFRRLKKATARVRDVLLGKGVSADKLCFGGEGAPPTKRP